jgi:uroporphyrin-III C-methyltransferase
MASPAPSSYTTSLLAALDCRGHIHLVLGTNPLAATRCGQSLSAGARPVLVAPATSILHYALQNRIDAGEVTWVRKAFEDDDLLTLGREEVGGVVDAVFVTSAGTGKQEQHVAALCRRHRIPVNVVDAPALCSFALLSTHVDGPLQVGVTTNGQGCKLAGRIRREVAAALPPGLGAACARLGEVRRRIRGEDRLALVAAAAADQGLGLDDSVDQAADFNRPPVAEADLDGAAKARRMRWLAQVCEYWPLKRLVGLTDDDVETVLRSYPGGAEPLLPSPPPPPRGRGRVVLAGSGPGHPDLLTRATYRAIQRADLVLADKLVPSAVLDLIPRRTPVFIARKFPGNADQAQEEQLGQALAGVRSGKLVLRLKQGDPFVYGRGGEEVDFFRRHGLADRVVVLPGITSSLAAPLFAGIPPTHRDVADQVLVCTGTGKKGRPPAPPGYAPARTVVCLMALHRIGGLVAELTSHTDEEAEKGQDAEAGTDGAAKPPPAGKRPLWPRKTPCAVVERASCPDQRVIRTTLDLVVEAVEQEGSRPPGLLVVGKACEVLYTPKKGQAWVVEEGFKGLDLDDTVFSGLEMP